MAGHRPFKELTKDWPPEWRQRIDEEKTIMLREMRQQELRRSREQTKQEVAEKLSVSEVGEDPPHC